MLYSQARVVRRLACSTGAADWCDWSALFGNNPEYDIKNICIFLVYKKSSKHDLLLEHWFISEKTLRFGGEFVLVKVRVGISQFNQEMQKNGKGEKHINLSSSDFYEILILKDSRLSNPQDYKGCGIPWFQRKGWLLARLVQVPSCQNWITLLCSSQTCRALNVVR